MAQIMIKMITKSSEMAAKSIRKRWRASRSRGGQTSTSWRRCRLRETNDDKIDLNGKKVKLELKKYYKKKAYKSFLALS